MDLDADMRKKIELKAGMTLRLFATISGRPKPKLTWTKQVTVLLIIITYSQDVVRVAALALVKLRFKLYLIYSVYPSV